MRRFNRTPCYTGPDDPERGQVRDTLQLGETVVIDWGLAKIRSREDIHLDGMTETT